jgi:TRAP-type C4-dicarboxylate transport system substrate-binding protein
MMTEAEFNALSPEDQEAVTAHRSEMAQHVTDSIETLERLAGEQLDEAGAQRIRERIPTSERKREEILRGQR